MHVAEHTLSIGVALRSSEPIQPSRLGKVHRATTLADAVHAAEHTLRHGVALRYSELKQPPRLGKVYRPALADEVHGAERSLRIGVVLRCSEAQQLPPGLQSLVRVGHGVPDERGELRRVQVRATAAVADVLVSWADDGWIKFGRGGNGHLLLLGLMFPGCPQTSPV